MWALKLLWTEWKRINYLNSLFQPENVPFNIKSYRFECNDRNAQLWLIICFWVFEKRLTQENCFLFCAMYCLFNGFIFLTIKEVLLSYFPNFHGQRSVGGGGGRQDLSISYLKQNCFSHGESSFKESIHKQFNSKWVVKFQANVS